MKQAIKFTLVAAAMTVVLGGCGKTEDSPIVPGKVDTPAGQGANGAAPTASDDLKRIRELAEKEDAEREAQKQKETQFGKEMRESVKEPSKVRTY